MPFNVGENVGPYRIIEQFGRGGMATVFKAYHASLDRYVALKVLHPAFNQDPNFEARFQREARVVAKLEHPNIVPIYDYAEHEKRPYLVMKFIEGITLKARMDQGSLSSEEILRITEAVGSALAYAHKQGVLHRDIKPSNVLLSIDGQVYLADFGLARIAQSGESTLSSDMIMGTPQYISPEQAMGKSDLDARTDLYSFGVMLYEMVVGKVPFNADTPFSIIHDHIFSPLPLPRAVNPNVSEQVERVLLKALAKERNDRFEDAGQMASAFTDAYGMASTPVQEADTLSSQVVREVPRPTEISEQTKVAKVPAALPKVDEKPVEAGTVSKPGKKRSTWIWVGAAAVVLALCLGGLVVVRNIRNNRSLAQQPEVPTQAPAQLPLATQPPANQPPPVDQPNNPQPQANEHLNLALDAWREKDMGRSMEEVKQLVNASPDQVDFLIGAGTQLYDAGQYMGAAMVYSRVGQTFREQNQPIPADVRERFESSFYFAAAMDEFPLYLPFDALRENDPALAAMTQSRYALLHGNMEIARRNLDDLLRINPDWYLTQLLNADVMFAEGRLLEPRKILQELIQSQAPDWVKQQADLILSKHQ